MKKSFFSRRQFLGISAAAAGASLAAKTIFLDPEPLFASALPVSPSDRLRFGIIGIGMQGNWLLSSAIELPGVECVKACDLYDGRHTLAREITSKPDLPVTRRYQELLADKDIDCLIAAVPDHWHKHDQEGRQQAGLRRDARGRPPGGRPRPGGAAGRPSQADGDPHRHA